MRKFINYWRYYSLKSEQYYECMKKTYKINLYSLRQANILVTILAGIFAVITVLSQQDLFRAFIYILTALISFLLVIISNSKIKQINIFKKEPNKLFIYILTVIYYANIMFFGIYLGVWLNPENYAVTFMILLVCSLFLFSKSPVFILCLTLGAMTVFIVCAVLVKPPEIYITDIYNSVFAALISLFICWRMNMLRVVSELNTYKLEDERNLYMDQSTIDELTQLRNRRDFMQTFQRYLSNYRSSDDFLCVAVSDIDFFKNYNDHYGHPKGDDALRAIGNAFNRLKDTMGVYCARVGGEEFALLWFEKDPSHVDAVISRVNKLIKTLKIIHEKSNVSEYLTMSIGVFIEKCGTSNDAHELYNLADKALYCAKGNGRNCAIVRGRDISQYQIKASS